MTTRVAAFQHAERATPKELYLSLTALMPNAAYNVTALRVSILCKILANICWTSFDY